MTFLVGLARTTSPRFKQGNQQAYSTPLSRSSEEAHQQGWDSARLLFSSCQLRVTTSIRRQAENLQDLPDLGHRLHFGEWPQNSLSESQLWQWQVNCKSASSILFLLSCFGKKNVCLQLVTVENSITHFLWKLFFHSPHSFPSSKSGPTSTLKKIRTSLQTSDKTAELS